jgi:tetratricopeptide (TPR) repeat protein
VEIDPLSPVLHAELAHAWLVNGRCDLARTELETIAQVKPPVGRASLIAAQCFVLEGKLDEAIAQLSRQSRSQRMRGFLLARAGRTDEARAILRDALAWHGRTGSDALDVAILYAGLRDFDQAFVWLDRSITDYSLHWDIMEPLFQDLRADPRFERIRQRLGLQKR